MKLKSTDFNDYNLLPISCGYSFGNKMPTLYVEDIPSGTKNLAVTIYDSDVLYYDRELTHWLAWDVPIEIGEFTDINLPPGVVQGTNDMGTLGYYGPVLEREIHHIHFLIFALKDGLNLGTLSGRKDFDAAVTVKYIDHSDLVGMYQPNTKS